MKRSSLHIPQSLRNEIKKRVKDYQDKTGEKISQADYIQMLMSENEKSKEERDKKIKEQFDDISHILTIFQLSELSEFIEILRVVLMKNIYSENREDNLKKLKEFMKELD